MAITAAELMVRVGADTTQMESDLDQADSRVSGFASQVSQTLAGIGSDFARNIRDALDTIVYQLSQVLVKMDKIVSKPIEVKVTVAQQEPDLKSIGLQMALSIVNGMASGIVAGLITAAFAATATIGWAAVAIAIVALLVAALALAFYDKIPDIGDALLNGIKAAWDFVIHGAGDLLRYLLDGIIHPEPIGELLMIKLGGYLAKKWVEDGIPAVLSGIRSTAGDLLEIGLSIVEGISDGVGRGWETFKAVVWALIKGKLVQPFFDLLRIGSPSQLFADEVGGPIVEGLLQGMVNAWGAVTSWVAGIPGALLGAFGGLAGALVQHGTDLITGLWDGAQSAWGSVTGWMGGLAQDAVGRLGEFGGTLVQAGTDLLTGLWDGAQSAWGSVIGWLGGLAGEAVSGIGELLDTLLGKGRDLLTGLWNGAQELWDGSVAGWLGERAGEALRLIGELAGTLVGKGKDLIGGLLEGLQNLWDSGVVAWLGRRGDEAVSAVGNIAEKLLEKGKELIQGHWEGMKQLWSGAGSVVEWLGKLGEEAVRAVGSLGKKLFQHGVDLVQGFIDGLNSMLDPLKRAAGGLGDIVGGVVGAFGRSPWPMMIAHGRDAGMGFKVGLEEQVPAVRQSAEELGRVAVSSVAAGMEANAPLATASLAALGTAVGAQLGQSVIDGARAALAEPSDAGVAQQVLALVAPSDEQFAEQGRSGAHALAGGYVAGLTDPALMEQVTSAGTSLIEALDLALAEGGQASLQHVADVALDISALLTALPEDLRGKLGTRFKLALDEFIATPTEQTRAAVIAQLERISQATALIPRGLADAAPLVGAAISAIVAQVDAGTLGIDEAGRRISAIMQAVGEDFLALPSATQEMVQKLAEDLARGVISAEQFAEEVRRALDSIPREVRVNTVFTTTGSPAGGGGFGGGLGPAQKAEGPGQAFSVDSKTGKGENVSADRIFWPNLEGVGTPASPRGMGMDNPLRARWERLQAGAPSRPSNPFGGSDPFGMFSGAIAAMPELDLLLRLIQSREERGEDVTDLLKELVELQRMTAESTLRRERERLSLGEGDVEDALTAFILRILDNHLATRRT